MSANKGVFDAVFVSQITVFSYPLHAMHALSRCKLVGPWSVAADGRAFAEGTRSHAGGWGDSFAL